MFRLLNLTVLLLCCFGSMRDVAQQLPPGFNVVKVTEGLTNPTAMAFAPDGRLFVTEQWGVVRVIKNGTLLPESMIELNIDYTGERGLVGIAVDPHFVHNGYIYVYYTLAVGPYHNRVSRFTVVGDKATLESELVLLEIEPPLYSETHNGGAMHFGPDGKLYIGIGDHAYGPNAQEPDSHHGKLLRINPDGSIPADNPHQTGSDAYRRTWASGLRNPYTFAIHPTTGRILVNDVGYVSWEEVNDATASGQNFGWPTTEGVHENPSFANPLFAYGHGSGDSVGCAITGGTFFQPTSTSYPAEWLNRYFFHDYCNQWIAYLDFSSGTPVRHLFGTELPTTPLGILTGPDGNLYFLNRDIGEVYKIIYSTEQAPLITTQPVSVSVFDGQSAQFRVSSLGATPISYQWQFNEVDIPGANGATYTIPGVSSAVAGAYRVVVSNAFGSDTSQTATLTTLGLNAPPMARILTPSNHARYEAGTTVAFSGTATDPEDGSLPASAFSWQVNFHHDTHRHDGPPVATGTRSGTFAIPNQGENSPHVWYRIILTVTDSKGLTAKDSVDLDPTLSVLNLTTDPPGLEIRLDGVPHTGPFSQSLVAGILLQLSTLPVQRLDTAWYQFSHWSPSLPVGNYLTMAETDKTYTAHFSVLAGGPRPLSLIQPLYNCQTGQLTFQTSGGDGTPVEYMALGVTGWTTNPTHTLDAGLRADADTLMLKARQGGVEVASLFAIKGYCQNRAPIVQNTQGLTAMVTAGKAFSYVIPADTFSDPDNHTLTLSVSGLPLGVVFDAATQTLSGTILTEGVLALPILATDMFEASVSSYLYIISLPPAVNDCSTRTTGPEIISVQDGPWHDPQTWSCYCVPAVCNSVRVSHRIGIAYNYKAQARKITYTTGGKLVMGAIGGLKIGN